ncbi:MAG: response regulator transcription factor [Kutzneria sp.]|nr:response regulator transcription factor [Kutzneria sp.]
MRVLVVEDEALLADQVATGLRRKSMAVDVAYTGDEALELLAVNPYDVLVLDRDLPGVRGDDICRRIVLEGGHSRVLMLTASTTLDDRVAGLDLGADDYLGKPFEYPELVARVRALARRAQPATAPVLEHRGVMVDLPRHQASRDGRHLRLSPKEFGVLEVLMTNPGVVVSTEQILDQIWDANTDPFTNAVRVTVSKLRAKLGAPPLIETVPRVGYRI